ncbi:hypothetical protein KP78_28730 [Jeotgalibacillus soli]|uniref:Uncharacterized protein n=1 Tax=Jeotgalibacillus soli TaxID=889306 RepID=A0A0C2RUA5_9BACL|nr:hypothetical protein KP78_28730 [Jeotgalibacillus soli]
MVDGDCFHYGCVPSKVLIDAAGRVDAMKTATALFGYIIFQEKEILTRLKSI